MKKLLILLINIAVIASSACDTSGTSVQRTAAAAETINEETDMRFDITVNGRVLTAVFAGSKAAAELAEKLGAGPVTVTLNEYGGFEKAGALPWPLTRTDEQTSAEPCDIMLYQGDMITIFYNPNSWSYTKLGHIENTETDELKEVLGAGDVTVTLSMAEQEEKQ